jgi:predicted glycosyltransferase
MGKQDKGGMMDHLPPARSALRDTFTNREISSGASRVLLYSHDSFGLGHFRRNLAIARALVEQSPQVNVLMVSGSPCATQFSLPDRCDVVKLPTVGKCARGRYVPRNLSISLENTLDLRRQLIDAAYRSFDPDAIIVDHQPTGLAGEALPMVRAARSVGKLTVFGMRDIVDAAEVVERDWSTPECREALERDYSQIAVYGDQDLFDAVDEYSVLRPLRDKISSVGYVATPVDRTSPRPVPTLEQQVLLTVGGGEDGAERVEAYVEALDLAPVDWQSEIVLGPLMKESRVRGCLAMVDRSRYASSIRVSRFHPDLPRLMRQSDVIVSMAGYNSCVEALRSRRPTILMPRDKVRHEQRIRAARFAGKGLAQSVEHPDPVQLREALDRAISAPDSTPASPNLDGLKNMCRLVGIVSGQTHGAVQH